MADLDRDYHIKLLQDQVRLLEQALNETRQKVGLGTIALPRPAK